MKKLFFFVTFVLVTALFNPVISSDNLDLMNTFTGFKFNAVHYLSYTTYSNEGRPDKFSVNRSYLTIVKKVNDNISSRITLDAHQDDSGDMKVRLKYAYADLKFKDLGFIAKPHAEFGLVHTVWLDFEEHINYYRMQGTMFAERSGLFNSADFGLTLMGYFGGEMDKNYQKTVSKKYPGRYGSFALGVYNGGGYHASEMNDNKVVQTRFTIRPLPDMISGLQFSYHGIFGKGNWPEEVRDDQNNVIGKYPDWQTNIGMVSWEHQHATVTGQYMAGKGNKDPGDSWVDMNNEPYDYSGMSFFFEIKPDDHWRLIGRYDVFDQNTDNDNDELARTIAGVGYDFGHQNILIIDFESTDFENSDIETDEIVKLTLQIHY